MDTQTWIADTPHGTERVEITRHGRPVAVIVSPDDLAALEETLEVPSSPEAMRQLAESRTAIAAGDVLDAEEFAALMARRRPPSGQSGEPGH